MTGRIAYAWEKDGKFYLSVIGPRSKLGRRPANIYETREQLLIAAAQRGLTVEWSNAN